MIFASDNWAGAHASITEGLARNAGAFATAYGSSDLDKKVQARLSDLFEREVHVFFVGTGTAANSLSMAACNRPAGVAFAHRDAHMIADEGGAPEYLTGGARLCPVDGTLGRIDPAKLGHAIARYPAEFVHAGRPMAVSITQATEVGTLYLLDQIEEISALAKAAGVPMHMDGARFANALVGLDVSPAEMTWKRGIDILSFGGTKNGCWCAEAVVVFEPKLATEMPFIRKRAAQLFSKSRFIAAQFDAYLADDLWLDLARHANDRAAQLANVFKASGSARLGWEPQANAVFAVLPKDEARRLQAAGAVFYEWHSLAGADLQLADDEALYRFVTSFATTSDDIERFGDLLS